MDDKNAKAKKPKATPPQPAKSTAAPQKDVATDGVSYTMPQKKGLKAWMIIVPVAALLVIAGVIILLVVLLAGPSKKDYSRALSNVRETGQTYRELNSQIRSSMNSLSTGSTASGAQDISDDLRDALGKYKDSVDSFTQQAALKDEEVRTSYDKLKEKSDGMVDYSENLLEALPVVAKVARSCDNLTKGSVIPSDAAFTACQDALDEGKQVKVEELRKIAEARSTFVNKVQDYAKVARGGSAVERLRARSQYLTAQTTYLTEAREQQMKLRELDKKHSVVDEINDLNRLLARKVNNR